MSTKYIIDSFERLANVINKDNVNVLSLDLLQCLYVYVDFITNHRELNPEATKDLTNSQIAEFAFNWIDDGKNDLLGVKYTDKRTGEEHFFKFPKNKTDE